MRDSSGIPVGQDHSGFVFGSVATRSLPAAERQSTPPTPMRYELVQYMPETIEPDVLYVSHEFGATMHICPCGCSREISCEIKPFWSDGWRLTVSNDKPTLYPSIANRICKAHYWIRDGEVVWA